MNSDTPPYQPFSLPDAWDVAKEVARTAMQVFGAPGEIARAGLPEAALKQLREWVRALEFFVRRLLVLVAAGLAAEGARRTEDARAPRAARTPRAAADFSSAESRDWPVSFILSGSPPPETRAARTPHGAPRPAPEAGALARRLEALLRVLENPDPWAQRLARRLRVEAHRLRAPPDLPYNPFGAIFDDVHFEAMRAMPRADTS